MATMATPAQRTYTVLLEPEADGSAWNVRVPALPGCFTYAQERKHAATESAKSVICSPALWCTPTGALPPPSGG